MFAILDQISHISSLFGMETFCDINLFKHFSNFFLI